jgi:hypothetical protein
VLAPELAAPELADPEQADPEQADPELADEPRPGTGLIRVPLADFQPQGSS